LRKREEPGFAGGGVEVGGKKELLFCVVARGAKRVAEIVFLKENEKGRRRWPFEQGGERIFGLPTREGEKEKRQIKKRKIETKRTNVHGISKNRGENPT